MFCTRCGKQCPDNSRFCENCGNPLDSAPTPRPAPVPIPVTPVQPLRPVQQPRPVSPPMPVRKKSHAGLIAALLVFILLLGAAGAGAYYVFRTRTANEAELEENLAESMSDYCQVDIRKHYDDVLPESFNNGGYWINPDESTFRLQPAGERNTFNVSGRFEVTDRTRDGVTCRVDVDGTLKTNFLRTKSTWDLSYDFEEPPVPEEEPEAQPDDSPAPARGDAAAPAPTQPGAAADAVTDPPETYLWPTDTAYITNADLAAFTRKEIMLMRNELYARYGCSFRDEEIRNYFLSQSWYTPDPDLMATDFTIDQFNDYERANLDTILSYERSMGWRK